MITWSAQYNIEIQSIDSNTGVILNAQINVFLDAKPKVACVGKIVLPQFVFSDLIKKVSAIKVVELLQTNG
jgi:hypothetical protein